jgi:hypothetical protein
MLATIPLTDDERAAVDDGQAALDQLLQRLADTPAPAGPTPRGIGVPADATTSICAARGPWRRAKPNDPADPRYFPAWHLLVNGSRGAALTTLS